MIDAPVDETLRALASTEEMLVLGFHLDEPAAEFELVCESLEKNAEASRAFALFRFCGVRQFEWRHGASKELRTLRTTFVSRSVRGSWVIQSVRSGKEAELSIVSLSLGNSFGGIEFRYEDVKHEVIQLYAKAKGPSAWDYFEVGTNRPVDFYNPFGRPWASVK